MGENRGRKRTKKTNGRMRTLSVGFLIVLSLFAVRLFFLQVIRGPVYQALAEGQHGFYSELFAKRGNILVRDWADGVEYAAATMAPSGFVYADPRRIEDPEATTLVLARLLGYAIPENTAELPLEPVADEVIVAYEGVAQADALVNRLTTPEDEEIEEVEEEEIADEQNPPEEITPEAPDEYALYRRLLARLSKEDDPYEPVQHGVRQDILEKIKEAKLKGIYSLNESVRVYPEQGMGGQLFGFFGINDTGERVGFYGLEGFHEAFLKGKNGFLASVRDASGKWIGVGGRVFERAQDGGDLLLTIDRTIQYEVCKRIQEGVEKYRADSGTVVVMEPHTGRIIAMCSYPNFEPGDYASVKNGLIFQNPATSTVYEPGSVMKPLVMAAAIDLGVITPKTTFNDTGAEKIDRFTIQNSDKKAHGLQTMTEVLEKSLNTGMIFAMRKMGFDAFQSYYRNFGFGDRTGIDVFGEVSGTIRALEKKSEIYYATASFGQGIAVTPIQLATAYSAIANGGYLMRPYLVEEKRYTTGVVEVTRPKVVRQVLSEKAAQQAGAMMVSVVENGHAQTAALPAYYVAGKTGTAQVPREDGPGYKPDHTRATFAGFAPLDDPQFVMVVILDHPRTSQWADSTTSPIWQQLAAFMLQYFEVTPQRTL